MAVYSRISAGAVMILARDYDNHYLCELMPLLAENPKVVRKHISELVADDGMREIDNVSIKLNWVIVQQLAKRYGFDAERDLQKGHRYAIWWNAPDGAKEWYCKNMHECIIAIAELMHEKYNYKVRGDIS